MKRMLKKPELKYNINFIFNNKFKTKQKTI